MAVRVCPIDPKKEKPTMDCFNKPENHLRRTDNSKAYWYISTGGSQKMSMEYKLPDHISCDGGCLLQWEWAGYQKCAYPYAGADLDILDQAAGKVLVEGSPSNICGGATQPELFYNCADIVIKSSSGSGYQAKSVTDGKISDNVKVDTTQEKTEPPKDTYAKTEQAKVETPKQDSTQVYVPPKEAPSPKQVITPPKQAAATQQQVDDPYKAPAPRKCPSKRHR